jgi:hypothetical protein
MFPEYQIVFLYRFIGKIINSCAINFTEGQIMYVLYTISENCIWNLSMVIAPINIFFTVRRVIFASHSLENYHLSSMFDIYHL